MTRDQFKKIHGIDWFPEELLIYSSSGKKVRLPPDKAWLMEPGNEATAWIMEARERMRKRVLENGVLHMIANEVSEFFGCHVKNFAKMKSSRTTNTYTFTCAQLLTMSTEEAIKTLDAMKSVPRGFRIRSERLARQYQEFEVPLETARELMEIPVFHTDSPQKLTIPLSSLKWDLPIPGCPTPMNPDDPYHLMWLLDTLSAWDDEYTIQKKGKTYFVDACGQNSTASSIGRSIVLLLRKVLRMTTHEECDAAKCGTLPAK